MARLNSEAADEMVATLRLPPGGQRGAELSIRPRPHPVTLWQWHLTVPSAAQCPHLNRDRRACPGAFSNSRIQLPPLGARFPPIATSDFIPVRIKQMAFALFDRGRD